MSLIFIFIFQTTLLKGKVYDRTDFTPLQAYITLSNTIQPCDSNGKFNFPALRPGNYRLIVSHIGYKTESLEVRLEENEEKFLSIGLQVISFPLKEVKVKAKKIPRSEAEKVTRKEIFSIPGGEKDLYKAVQVLPGVSSPSDYLGLAYVRGGELYENLTLLDGTEVLMPYHYFGVSSTFNTTLVDNFDFITGAFPARYGDVLSSILSIQTKKYHDIKPHANIRTNLMESDWTYSHSFNPNCYMLFSARRSYLDLIVSRFIEEKSYILPYYLDFQCKIGLDFAKDHFVFNVLSSKNETSMKADFPEVPLDLKIKELGNSLGVNWERKITDNINIGIVAYYTAASRHIFGSIPAFYGEADEKSDKSKYKIISNSSFKFSAFEYEMGLGLGNLKYFHQGPRIEDLLYSDEFNEFNLTVDTADNNYFAYIIQKSELLKPIYSEFGLRFEKMPVTKKFFYEPRLLFSYLKSPFEIYFGGSSNYHTTALEYISQQYEPSCSKIITSGISYEIEKALFAKLELYYKHYHNLVICDTVSDTSLLLGKGFARGVEISLRKYDEKRFFGWLSYAFSIAKRSTPYDEELTYFFADRPHILNLVFGTHLSKDLTFTLTFKWMSGSPYYKLIGKEWYPGYYKGWVACWSPTQVRFPDYQRLDIKFSKSFNIYKVKGEVYLSIINLMNRKNVQSYFYDSSCSNKKTYYMFPRIPLLGFDLEI
ncbi:MAG: TonB-dependent receptor [candidate division WOR-3 bacterium]|nr:TonB-dependent receptor [candidate division WOR-3 bacterium]MDH5683603.1 TonB-dependent receptor [candidate division WOR-3 bacterium]